MPTTNTFHIERRAPGGDARAFRDPHQPRILLVEDDPDTAWTLADLLLGRGYEVVLASDGRNGLAAAHEHAPDVALIDICLPNKNGNSLAAEIRWEIGDAIRLIAMTGDATPDARERALSAGFDTLMVKPLDVDALLAAIEHGGPGRGRS